MQFALSAIGILLLGAALLVAPAAGQPYEYIWDNDSGNNSWGTNANWNVGASGQVNNVVPMAFYHETALIKNGDTVNVSTAQTQRIDNATMGAVAGVVVTNNSTLNIAGTGRLNVLITYADGGAATTGDPVVGTGDLIVNAGGAVTIQSGGQLNVADDFNVNNGTLTVMPGGQVAAQSVGSGANGAIVLSGNASLSSSGSTTLSGQTTITGPGVTFDTNRIVMTASTVFNPVVTGASHSIINVDSTVTMDGTLRPQFQSVTPQLGNTWVLWDSSNTLGQFDVLDDSLTPLPTGHRYNVITTTTGSVNGTRGLLTVENFLTAEVNRANGQVRLRNTASTGGVTIDGYQITSNAGTLNPNALTNGFADSGFGGGGWQEASVTNNRVAEVNPFDGSLFATSSSHNLGGNLYNPIPTLQQFAAPVPEDLVFTYRQTDGRVVTGAVEYINDGVANTFVLQVDPTDGKARIVNDSTFGGIQFAGYTIRSQNSLNPNWQSLQDQGVSDWIEAAASTSMLAELNRFEADSIGAGETAAVMTGVFNTAGEQDLVFEFLAATPGGSPDGDYNADGVVDAADYTVWRDSGGTSAQYQTWRTNFGSTGGGEPSAFQVYTGVVRYVPFPSASGAALAAAAVPEPATVLLLAPVLCQAMLRRRRNYRSPR